jgi:hypothetical protein
LLRVAQIPNLESVAFPWKIGCGAAGGIWEHYLVTLTNFANYIEDSQGAKVLFTVERVTNNARIVLSIY